MSRVELLAGARDSLSVKFLEFTRIVSKPPARVAFFFEGEDEKYFSIRIRSIRPDLDWVGVNCGGKNKVIALRGRIRSHEEYSESPCAFFVDADFDDNSEHDKNHDIYVTPCYSIENLYVSNDVFRRVLRAEFNISEFGEESSCMERATSLFEATKKSYLEQISDFNYLIMAVRIKEGGNAERSRLNINNVNFDDLIKVGIESCEKIYNKERFPMIFPDLESISELNLSSSESHFFERDKELWLRGKQHLEFMRQYIALLKLDRCKSIGRIVFQNKGNVKLQMSKGNCISELSPYADTPSCLAAFLTKFGSSSGVAA